MSEIDIKASSRWRGLLSEDVAVYETSRFVHSPGLFAEESAIVRNAAPSRVEEFAAGRVCARRALADLGYPPSPLLRDPDRRPAWPAGCHGSITHTDGHCAAAVALARLCSGIGIDAEVAGRVGEGLEPRICTGDEMGRLQAMDGARRRLAATVIFSAKEAFFKSQSHMPGALRDFHDVEIQLGEATFLVSTQRALPEALRTLGAIKGHYRIEDGLVYSGIVLPGPES